jgi:transcriptional regulator with XRE-family HTH domain
MRNGTPGFCPDRLIEARAARAITQVALAELTGRTSSSISRWEAGDQSPEPEALQALSRALNLPMSFFLRAKPDHGSAPMFARSMASATQSIRRRVCARLRWAQDVSLALQDYLDLPEVSVPRLEVGDYREIRPEDIEQIALECRRSWGLGLGPISDLILVLENAGICVIKDQVDSASMDGLSNWSAADGRPYILIAKDKQTCARSRLDAAHELGHLVLLTRSWR